MRLLSVALLLAVIVPNAASAQVPGQKLSGAEIQAVMFGHVWQSASSDGGNFRVTINKDGGGGREGVNPRGQQVKQVGRFRVTGDQWCRFYENVDNNRTRCFDIHRQGDKLLQIFEGNINSVMTKIE